MLTYPRNEKLFQVLLADQETLFALDSAILMLDGENAVVAISTQRGDELAPAYLPQAGNDVPPPALSLVADPSAFCRADFRIFRVDMEDTVGEAVYRVDIV